MNIRYCFITALLCLSITPLSGAVQTTMPIIKLQYSALSKDTFSAAQFAFINEGDTLSLPITIRHRGATSTKYKKKSYAIKLYDENGQKKDTSLFGMRKDNYWILEAMASDKARMRNRVAMDLWLDFSSKPSYKDVEPKVCNGYPGKFVEVYVNEEYNGIYCLMERVDRKQLKLKKSKNDTINGVLYKSVSWNGSFFGDLTPYDNNSPTWMRYEYEYPDVEEDGLIDWKPLYDAFDFVGTASAEAFVNEAPERYDIPIFMDLYLFTNLLSARDNTGKNLYLSFYNINQNSKLLVTPWDIDHSFGRMYNSNEESPNRVCVWSDVPLYQRLTDDMPDYYPQLLARYAYLRHNQFSLSSLCQRFTDYFDLFESTGAAEREIARWNGVDGISLDFSYEESYICSWIEQRLSYTDSLFEYDDVVTKDNHNVKIPSPACKFFKDGQLLILREGVIYNAQGVKLNNK